MFAGSYGFNGWLYDGGKKDGGTPGFESYFFTRESSIQKPSQTPVFFDEIWVDAWPFEADSPATDLYSGRSYWERTNEVGRCTIARHGEPQPFGSATKCSPREATAGGHRNGPGRRPLGDREARETVELLLAPGLASARP